MTTVVTVEGMAASVGRSDIYISYFIEEGTVPQSTTNSSLGRQHYMHLFITTDLVCCKI